MLTPPPSTSTMVRFFKIITKASLEDGKFRIPDGFTRKCVGDMSNPVFLNTPDGRKSKINWTKVDGDIRFEKGWKEFATYYSLNHGHSVLFEYDERKSDFGVRIFDKSTFEIEYPFHGNQCENNNCGQIRVAKCRKTRPKSPMPSPQLQKRKLRSNTSEDVGTRSKLQNLPTVETLDETPESKKTKGKSPMSSPQPLKKLKTEESEDRRDNSNLQNFTNHVGDEEDAGGCNTECPKVEMEPELLSSKIIEALEKAKDYKSNYPTFTVVMISTFINQHLYVPSKFAKKYLKEKQCDILLQVLDDRTWLAKYHLGRIDVGWTTFVSNNNLRVGDVCVFELTKSQSLTLKVLIFRFGEEPRVPPSQVSVQGDGSNPENLLDAESKTVISSGNTSKGSLDTNGSKKTQKNSQEANPLSSINEALNEANRFTSENPFFMITVNTKPPVRQVCVPNNFARMYLKRKKQTVMLKVQEKKWPVMLLCYPYWRSNNLSRGWPLFVEESKLKTGDVCVFELTNNKDVVFDVHIFRNHS